MRKSISVPLLPLKIVAAEPIEGEVRYQRKDEAFSGEPPALEKTNHFLPSLDPSSELILVDDVMEWARAGLAERAREDDAEMSAKRGRDDGVEGRGGVRRVREDSAEGPCSQGYPRAPRDVETLGP